MVGEVAHRVQRLLRGAGGDGNAQTGKIFGPGNGMQDILDQHIFLRQTAAATSLQASTPLSEGITVKP